MYSYDNMAGLDQLMSGINQYGTFSNIPSSFFTPDYWDMSAFNSPSFSAPQNIASFGQGSGYGTTPYQQGMNQGLLTGGAQSPGFFDQAGSYLSGLFGNIGGMDGLMKLGLGGLSAWGAYQNYQQQKKMADAATRQMETDAAMKEAQFGDEFAKMHALAQIIQDRQGINLDPSLAYAQALRRKYGVSPDNANDFAGIDIGGPMKVGMSSEDRLRAIQDATGATVGLKAGGLGLLRGGTSGQADEVNARLSDGEYVMDADVVAALGDGNTEAGARKLDQMREQVRKHKRSASHKSIPPAAKDPMKYMKG